jgi:hypothetical protein
MAVPDPATMPPIGSTMPPPGISDASSPEPYAPIVATMDGAAPGYVLAGVTQDGKLVAAYWNGGLEIVVRLDPKTAQATFEGLLGCVYEWDSQFVYDPKAGIAYAVGHDREGSYGLCSVSLYSNWFNQRELPVLDGGAASYVLGGVTSAGFIPAAYWDGSMERVVLIEPVTSKSNDEVWLDVKIEPAGTLGDLHDWSSQLVYDRTRNVLLATGTSDEGEYRLYELDLDASVTTSVVLPRPRGAPGMVHGSSQDYTLGGVGRNGTVFAAYWNGAAEAIAGIAPDTGATDVLGGLGTLTSWSNQLVLDDKTGSLYAIGQDAAGITHIYSALVDPPTSR